MLTAHCSVECSGDSTVSFTGLSIMYSTETGRELVQEAERRWVPHTHEHIWTRNCMLQDPIWASLTNRGASSPVGHGNLLKGICLSQHRCSLRKVCECPFTSGAAQNHPLWSILVFRQLWGERYICSSCSVFLRVNDSLPVCIWLTLCLSSRHKVGILSEFNLNPKSVMYAERHEWAQYPGVFSM